VAFIFYLSKMKKQTKIFFLVVVLLAGAMMVVYGIRQSKDAPKKITPIKKEETGKIPIKVGFLHPLTGEAAPYGEVMRNTATLAVEEINKAGGVNGRLIELIVEDGKCTAKDAESAMKKLVNSEQVKIVIGGFCSSESLAAIPIATKESVVLFSPGARGPELTGTNAFFVRDYPSDGAQGSVLADKSLKKGWKKVAVIQEKLDESAGIFLTFATTFGISGGTVEKEEFSTMTTDFRPILLKLRAGRPDALFIDSQTSASGERVLKEVSALKWPIPLLITKQFATDKKTIDANKSSLEGALAADVFVDQKNEKFQHLAAAYKEKYGNDLPFQQFAQSEYDAVYLTRDALAAVGEDGEKLSVWLRSVIDWKGASGSITIGSDGARLGGYIPLVIKDGKTQVIQDGQTAQ